MFPWDTEFILRLGESGEVGAHSWCMWETCFLLRPSDRVFSSPEEGACGHRLRCGVTVGSEVGRSGQLRLLWSLGNGCSLLDYTDEYTTGMVENSPARENEET